MSDCRSCGAPISHAQTVDGEAVPLEKWEDTRGVRYRVIELGPPLICEPIPAASTMAAYPDHRLDCPGHDNGN